MRAHRLKYSFLMGLSIAVFCLLPEKTPAQENADRNGFYLGAWAGYGLMDVRTDNAASTSNGTFALSFRGGHTVTSRAVIGLELNGWTLKAFDVNDPAKGESLSNISIFLNFFPLKDLPLYVTGGAGRLSYTNNSPQVNGRDHGGSWFVGTGYEIPVSNELKIVPQIRYAQGNFTNGDFKVYELTIGLSWYSGKAGP